MGLPYTDNSMPQTPYGEAKKNTPEVLNTPAPFDPEAVEETLPGESD